MFFIKGLISALSNPPRPGLLVVVQVGFRGGGIPAHVQPGPGKGGPNGLLALVQLLVTFLSCACVCIAFAPTLIRVRYGFFNTLLWSIARGLHAASQDPWLDPWQPEALKAPEPNALKEGEPGGGHPDASAGADKDKSE